MKLLLAIPFIFSFFTNLNADVLENFSSYNGVSLESVLEEMALECSGVTPKDIEIVENSLTRDSNGWKVFQTPFKMMGEVYTILKSNHGRYDRDYGVFDARFFSTSLKDNTFFPRHNITFTIENYQLLELDDEPKKPWKDTEGYSKEPILNSSNSSKIVKIWTGSIGMNERLEKGFNLEEGQTAYVTEWKYQTKIELDCSNLHE